MQKYCEITSCDVGLGDMTTYDEPYDTWKNKVDELMRLCFKKKTVNKGVNQEIKPSVSVCFCVFKPKASIGNAYEI